MEESRMRMRIGREFRVLYIARFAEAVYVLHAFEKKSQKTAGRDVEDCREAPSGTETPAGSCESA